MLGPAILDACFDRLILDPLTLGIKQRQLAAGLIQPALQVSALSFA